MISPVGCKLADRPEILQTLIELTMTSIDIMKDQMEGYPGEVCKRCMISINNFSKGLLTCPLSVDLATNNEPDNSLFYRHFFGAKELV